MTRPKVSGNTKRERVAHLRSVGCPEHLIPAADEWLKFMVTPMRVPSGWKVAGHLSDITARQAVRHAAAERGR
jgi:hypothetical protein